jgi:hypothetical protein
MRRVIRIGVAFLAAVAVGSLLPANAAAQTPKKPRKRPPAGATGAAGTFDPSINSSRRLLSSWLDDANTPDKGGGFFEVDAVRWQAANAAETDAPSLDFGYAVTDSLQLGASGSLARASYLGAPHTMSLGDTYLESKYQVRDAEYDVIGIAVSPALEILGSAVARDPALHVSRVNLVLPVTLQHSFDHGAIYGTVAYFSRGVASVGVEAEHEIGNRVTLAGLVTYAYATRAYFTSATSTTARSRTDVAGEIYVSVSDSVTLTGSVGRTASPININAATLAASVGLKVEWNHITK